MVPEDAKAKDATLKSVTLKLHSIHSEYVLQHPAIIRKHLKLSILSLLKVSSSLSLDLSL